MLATWLPVVLPLFAAVALGGWIHQHERRAPSRPDAHCAATMTQIEALASASKGSPTGPWLDTIRQNRERCGVHSAFVRTASVHLSAARLHSEARSIVEEARRRGTLVSAEATIELGYVDLGEAQALKTDGQFNDASRRFDGLIDLVDRLSRRWPDWDEVDRLRAATLSASEPHRLQALGAKTPQASPEPSGTPKTSVFRHVDTATTIVVACILFTAALWFLEGTVYATVAFARLNGVQPSPIARAQPGYVERSRVDSFSRMAPPSSSRLRPIPPACGTRTPSKERIRATRARLSPCCCATPAVRSRSIRRRLQRSLRLTQGRGRDRSTAPVKKGY